MNTSKPTTKKPTKKAGKKTAAKKTTKKVAKKKAEKKPYGGKPKKGYAIKHLLVCVSNDGDVMLDEPDEHYTEAEAIENLFDQIEHQPGDEIHHVVIEIKIPPKPVAKKTKAKKVTKVHTIKAKPEVETSASKSLPAQADDYDDDEPSLFDDGDDE